ncbi:class E sortase [Frondihabitans australicus]|uniref:Sortase A n=1 Tax=Frondihabitans australicus TaxID=386892 RepID=A0A495ILS3_9MICO|nr:class E sortase [Frondihabitans australicus]RKR76211.1 sortase A [Frondihabitans australicus]
MTQRGRRARRSRRSASAVLAGLLAELLLLGGSGIGLYVLWSTWYTDVTGVAAQNAIVEQLRLPETKPGGAERPATDTDIPVLAEPQGLADVFGTMRIPRFGADYERPIGEGIDRQKVLNTIGLGHYEGTAMPGGVGNFAVAGHRVTYGKPLNQIAELKTGDPIVVRATDKAAGFDVWYVYEVTDAEIVTPDHVETIAPVPNRPGVSPSGNDRWLTLTACHPMWSAAERYVVHAKLTAWMNAKDGTPKELSKGARP